MTIQDELFKSLTAFERDSFQKMGQDLSSYSSPSLSKKQIYSYELFMRLMSKERFMEDIESDPYELFDWLPDEFRLIQDFAQDGPVTLEEIEYYAIRLQNLIADTNVFLELEKTKITAENPLALYNKVYADLLAYLDKHVLKQWEVLIENKESLKDVEKYFNLDLINKQFVPKFNFDPEKKWLDLAPYQFYFDRESLLKAKEYLLKQTFTQDIDNALEYFNELEEKILPDELESIKDLKIAMAQYDSINKSSPALLNKRILALKNIAKKALNASEAESSLTEQQKSLLKEIQHQATSKKNYLSEIKLIPQKAEHRAYRTEHISKKPLVVDKMEWFEDLDPAHREHHKEIYEKWLNQALLNESTPNYWIWLEGLEQKDVVKFETDKRYSVPKEDKFVLIKNGLCYNNKCSIREDALIADGIYLFNIDRNNDLYILPSPRNYPGRGPWSQQLNGQGVKDPELNFNHNSVLNGENVKCAGCVFIKDGKIVQIDTNSGHYKPQMSNLQNAVKEALFDQNVFKDDAVVANFDGDHAVSVKDFVQEDFDIRANFPKEREMLTPEEILKLKSESKKPVPVSAQKEDKEKLKRKLLVWAKSINKEKGIGVAKESTSQPGLIENKNKKKLS